MALTLTITKSLIHQQRKPVDARTVVATRSLLATVVNPYPGMQVYIQDLKKLVLITNVQLNPDTGTYVIDTDKTQTITTKLSSDSISWKKVSNTPTSISGYGITDVGIQNNTVTIGSDSLVVAQNWIGTLQLYEDIPVKDPDTVYFITLSLSITWSDIKNTPTTLFGYGLKGNAFISDRRVVLDSNSVTVPFVTLSGRTLTVDGTPIIIPESNSGTADYNSLYNKPKLNGIVISDSKTADDYGLAKLLDIPLKLSDLLSDSKHRTVADSQVTSWNNKQDIITSNSKLDASLVKGLSKVATTGSFYDLTIHPTTIKDYGITDAKIEGSKVILGSNSINVASAYTLPKATSNSLGGIKVGANLSIDSTGKLSAVDTVYTLPKATSNSLGGIKVGTNLSIDSLGKLSCPNSTQVTIGDNGNWFFNGVDSHHKATGQGSNVVFSPTPPSDIYDGMIWVQAPTGTSTQYYNIDPIDVRLSSTLPATPSNGTIWIKK